MSMRGIHRAGVDGSCNFEHMCSSLGGGSGPCMYARHAPGVRAGGSMRGTHRARGQAGPVSIHVVQVHTWQGGGGHRTHPDGASGAGHM